MNVVEKFQTGLHLSLLLFALDTWVPEHSDGISSSVLHSLGPSSFVGHL